MINEIPHTSLLNWEKQENLEMTLLMLVLSMIYLTEGRMITQGRFFVKSSDKELKFVQSNLEKLYEHLKKLGFREKEPHPEFGDWAKLIETKFPKELYLERTKKKGEQIYEYRVGSRAKLEISKKSIVEFISKQVRKIEKKIDC